MNCAVVVMVNSFWVGHVCDTASQVTGHMFCSERAECADTVPIRTHVSLFTSLSIPFLIDSLRCPFSTVRRKHTVRHRAHIHPRFAIQDAEGATKVAASAGTESDHKWHSQSESLPANEPTARCKT